MTDNSPTTASMTNATIELVRDGPVLHVWLNRPLKHNALNTEVLEGIARVFIDVQTDFDVRVVVLGGRGPSFSSGADRRATPGRAASVTAAATMNAPSDREHRYAGQIGLRACNAIADCEVPTIARVQGWCIGGGFALALACDFRIASHDARFSIPEVDLGVPLTWGATPRLIAEIGAARARELILMCDAIDAAQAYRLGVAHRHVPAEQLDVVVADWARRLATKPELAVNEAKSQFRAYARRSVLGDFTEADGDLLARASTTDAARNAFGSGTDN